MFKRGALWSITVPPGGHLKDPAIFEIRRVAKIGRSTSADIVIDHPSISRFHARLEPQPEGIRVIDNGTYIDGQSIQDDLWRPGQLLRAGSVELAFASLVNERADFANPSGGTMGQSRRLMAGFWTLRNRPNPVKSPGCRLIWRKTDRAQGGGGERTLDLAKTLSIGSHLACDIVLDDPFVSKRHAEVTFRDGIVTVSDLGSSNGSFINGERIDRTILSAGQALKIGSFAFSIARESVDDIMLRATDTILVPSNKFEKLARSLKQQHTIFISYSRQNIDVADQMDASLTEKGFNVSIDRRSLPFGEQWQQELARLIRNCDTALFLVTASSIASQMCMWELELIGKLQKRLFPIIIEPVDVRKIPIDLGRVQVVPSSGPFSFRDHMPALVMALNTNQAWVKEHSRLQSRAREWLGKGKAESFLLRGDALKVAIAWNKAAPPTEICSREVVELIRVSRIARRNRAFEQLIWSPLPVLAIIALLYYWPWSPKQATQIVFREFCEKLRDELNARRAIEMIDDRCVLPADITFASGQADLTDEGRRDMDQLAAAVRWLMNDTSGLKFRPVPSRG